MSETTEPGSQEAAPAYAVFASEGEAQDQSPAQAVEPEAPEASAAAEPDPGEAPSEDKTPAWAKKRFGELTAKQRAAEAERDFWREQAVRAQQPTPQPTQQAEQPAAPTLPPDLAAFVGAEPKPADYPAGEWDPEYNRAVARYEVKAAQAAGELSRRSSAQQQQQAEMGRRIASVVDEARGAGEHVAAALADPHFPLPQHVVLGMMDMEKPASVLAHLAANPDEAARLAGLRPQSAALIRELAKIEARLSAAPPAASPAPPKPSNAPAPPPAFTGRAAPARTAHEATSYEEYRRIRMGG